jgi:hypothetical protein
MELLDNLVQHLGVNEEQAKGGTGLILKMAKEKLDGEDFQQISNIVPDTDDMIKTAPESSGIAGAIGGLVSGLGGSAGKMGDLAKLAGGFSKLGLNKDMVGKFLPEVISFAESKGGDTVKNILQKVFH